MVDGVRNGFGVPGRRGRPRSWVYTAGTVARIDLRLPHHPRSGSPLLRCVRYNRSQARVLYLPHVERNASTCYTRQRGAALRHHRHQQAEDISDLGFSIERERGARDDAMCVGSSKWESVTRDTGDVRRATADGSPNPAALGPLSPLFW